MSLRSMIAMAGCAFALAGCECESPVRSSDAGDGGTLPDARTFTDAPSDSGRDARTETDAHVPRCEVAEVEGEAFFDAYTDALCRWEIECGTYFDDDDFVAACQPGVFDASFAQARALLRAGHLAIDAENACACIDALRTGQCGVSVFAAACAYVYGPVGPDASCASGLECGIDAYCVRTDGECPGTCVDYQAEGEPCGASVVCRPLALSCIDGFCATPPGVGEPCSLSTSCAFGLHCDSVTARCRGPSGAGEECSEGTGCTDRLVCTGADPRCEPGAAESEPCSENDRCALGHRCVEERCVRTVAPGGACEEDEQCTRGFICDGTCIALPDIGDPCPGGRCFAGTCTGGTCVRSENGAPCDLGLGPFFAQCEGYCDFETELCVASAGQDEACTFYECAAGLACDGMTRTCQPACTLD